jgi:hypothetical protein
MMNTKLAAPAILSVFLLTVSATFCATIANAESRPWHLWKNNLDGQTQCARSAPAKNWANMGGTFRNARCQTAQSRSGNSGADMGGTVADGTATPATATPIARLAPAETGRKHKMLELMTIFVTARSSR